MAVSYKKFLFLGTTGVITEQDTAADGIEVTNLKVNSLSAGVLHADSSGVVSSSSVATGDLADSAITSAKIADSAVSTQKLADSAVAEAKLASGAVTSDKLGALAVVTGKIADAAVTGAKIASGAVDTTQLADAAVITAKLADAAVTTAKIADLAVTNAKLAGEIADSKLLSGVASANTSGTIVKRDGSGNFSAGTITAALSGNASTASKWQNSHSISFAGGDVTGTISGLDGSADISSVSLTIGSAKVTNDMLAGSISNDKLLEITQGGLVNDSALSSNVALLDRNSQKFTGTAPEFSNPLIIAEPSTSHHAASKNYVDTAVAAATSGLDYKQEAKWYFNLPNVGGSISAFLSLANGLGGGAPFAAGQRVLFNDESGANAAVGIYVFGGSAGSFTLARADDFKSGSATGAWIYCLQTLAGSPPAPTDLDTAYVCPSQADVGSAIQFVVYAAGKTYTATAPITMTGTDVGISLGNGVEVSSNALVAKANSFKAIEVTSDGIGAVVDDSTIKIDDSHKIAFKSLPSLFKVNGVAVSANVTAENLKKLVDGAVGDATSMHHHEVVLVALDRDSGEASFSAGTPLIVNSSGKLVRAAKDAGKCIGVSFSDESGAVLMATSGIVSVAGSLWTSTAPANGEAAYLGDSGKLAKYSDLGAGDYVTKVGRMVSGGKLAVAIQDVGKKA
jgi:hypothetical protein